MASESKTTTDHKTIQAWSEARGGKPATVKSTERDGEAGVLRIDFPGYSGAGSLEEISWEEFFAKFDEKNLAFLYQEHTSSGEESRFFKLVSRATSSEKSSAHHNTKAEHKGESKSTAKAEHKEESKSTAKADDKEESKAHKPKAEHKEESKAHKVEEKPHKTTKK